MPSIVTFYHFFDLRDPAALREHLHEVGSASGVRGSMQFSTQGLNATLAGSRESLEGFIAALQDEAQVTLGNCKWSEAELEPFRKLRMFDKERLLGLPEGTDPREKVGTYVPPAEWNALIQRDDVTVIDVRNWYEYYVGTFEGATDPATETFAEFGQWVDEKLEGGKVAMFCTGGIRCEVATGMMLEKGFDEVYHLEGGILKYLEEVPEEESLWRGECFVFDERVSVTHELAPGTFERCRGCSAVLSEEDRKHDDYEEGVRCASCSNARDPARIEGARERVRQMQLAELRAEKHLGNTHPRHQKKGLSDPHV